MPYVRLKQVVRVAAEREAEEERNQWLRAAFIGYQLGAPYRKRPLSFGQYLRQVGLAPSSTSASPAPTEDLAVVKNRALAAADRIRERDGARR